MSYITERLKRDRAIVDEVRAWFDCGRACILKGKPLPKVPDTEVSRRACVQGVTSALLDLRLGEHSYE